MSTDVHLLSKNPRLPTVRRFLRVPPERLSRDIREDPALRETLPHSALQDYVPLNLPSNKALHGTPHCRYPGALPRVYGGVIDSDRGTDRNYPLGIGIIRHPDILHRSAIEDPTEVHLAPRTESHPAGSDGFDSDNVPISDELSEEHELLFELWVRTGCTKSLQLPNLVVCAHKTIRAVSLHKGFQLLKIMSFVSAPPSGYGRRNTSLIMQQ